MSDPLEKTSSFRVPPRISSPASCAVCGCRLETVDGIDGWQHFRSDQPGQDARGCRPACIDLVHDRLGVASTQAVPA